MVAALLSLQVQLGVLQLCRQPLELLLQLLTDALGLLVICLQVTDLEIERTSKKVIAKKIINYSALL